MGVVEAPLGSLIIRLTTLFVLIAVANLMFVELAIVNGVIFASVAIAFATFVKERGREHRYQLAISAFSPIAPSTAPSTAPLAAARLARTAPQAPVRRTGLAAIASAVLSAVSLR
jgi:hypothetical protein